MNDETAINIAVTSVMASALDNDTKQEVIKVLRALEEQQKEIEQLNYFIQFQSDILNETKMELKGAKEDYSRLLKTAEEITEQQRQEIEKLKKDLKLQKESVAGWARQYQHSQEKFDMIRGLINDTELGLGDDCTLDCEEAIEQIQKVLEAEG